MNGPAGRVPGELLQVQHLCDRALPGKGSVAVDKHGERLPLVANGLAGVRVRRLPGPRHPFDDGVDGFEMRGIGGEPDLDPAVRGLQAAVRA